MNSDPIQATAEKAKRFLERDIETEDDFEVAKEVLRTLGAPRDDSETTKRHVRFLLSGVKRFAWTWESLGCEPPGPMRAVDAGR